VKNFTFKMKILILLALCCAAVTAARKPKRSCYWQWGKAKGGIGYKMQGIIMNKEECQLACEDGGYDGAMTDAATARHCYCGTGMTGRVLHQTEFGTPKFVSCLFDEVIPAAKKAVCNWQKGDGVTGFEGWTFGLIKLEMKLDDIADRDICVQMCIERQTYYHKINGVTVDRKTGKLCYCELKMEKINPKHPKWETCELGKYY